MPAGVLLFSFALSTLGQVELATAARAPGPRVDAAVVTLSYLSHTRPSQRRFGLELAAYYAAARWEVGGGLRVALPFTNAAVPLEVFARGRWVARVGRWEPAIGPELGLSGFTQLTGRPNFPTEGLEAEQQRVHPLYLALNAAPLRARFGRWTLSALELQLGTVVAPFGAAARLQVSVFSAGASL